MAVQPVEDGEVSPTWARLEDQLDWYDRKSVAAQWAYKRVKLSQLIIGAAVPVFAASKSPPRSPRRWPLTWSSPRVPNSCTSGRPTGCSTAPPRNPSSTRSISTSPLPAPTTQMTGTVFSLNASKAWFPRSMPNGRNHGKKTANLLRLSQSAVNRDPVSVTTPVPRIARGTGV